MNRVGARRRISCALLLATLALPPVAARGDFESAAAAIEQGDFNSAIAELEPMAAAGDPRAQDALATLYFRGLGVERDVRAGMSWYCMLAHHAEGGRGIMQAVWFLAEWFRTGGGMPGKHYNDGKRAEEDPIRAYFWFSVMAEQESLYQSVDKDSVRLGKIGRTAVGSVLFEQEKNEVHEAVTRWQPAQPSASPEDCLRLPNGVEAAPQWGVAAVTRGKLCRFKTTDKSLRPSLLGCPDFGHRGSRRTKTVRRSTALVAALSASA